MDTTKGALKKRYLDKEPKKGFQKGYFGKDLTKKCLQKGNLDKNMSTRIPLQE